MVFGNNQGKLKSFETLRIYFSQCLWGKTYCKWRVLFFLFQNYWGDTVSLFNKLFECIVDKVLEKEPFLHAYFEEDYEN